MGDKRFDELRARRLARDKAMWTDECAPYPSSSRAALESRDADARRESTADAATYPGGRGTGAGVTTHELWCAIQQGYSCNCGGRERRAADDARAEGEPSVPEWAKAMFDAKTSMIQEQAERIDGLEATIREQGEELASLKVHLGQQIAQMYKDARDGSIKRCRELKGMIEDAGNLTAQNGERVAQLEDWKARAIEAVSQLGTQQTEEDN